MKKHITISAFLNLIFLISISSLYAQKKTKFDFFNPTGAPADYDQTYTVPACVTTITVEVWGGSGSGYGTTGNGNSGGGGGGGAYSMSVLTVAPNTAFDLHIGEPTQDTWFDSPTIVMAKAGASSTNINGGAGGDAGASIGDVTFSGGNGGGFSGDAGGGGGATAGPLGNGSNGSDGNGDLGGQGGTGNPDFGNGGAGGADNVAGDDNSMCPGCGAGGGSGRNGGDGGFGSQGYVRVTIPAPLYATLSSPQTICPGTSPANITTTASGANGGPYTYSWEESTTDSTSGFTAIGGETADNLSPAAINTTTWYRAIVADGDCTPDTTNTVEVFVSALSGTTSFPQTICTGNTPSPLTAIPEPGGIPTTYVWESSTTSATGGFSVIGGETASTYAPPGPLNNTTWYRAIIGGPGCTDFTTDAVDAVPTDVPATAFAGKANTTIYSTNTYTFIASNVGGSATTGAWSITNSNPGATHTLSTTAQTNAPDEVTFTPEIGFVGDVELTLTSNVNGCNVAVATKTVTVIASYEIEQVFNTNGDYTWTVPGCVATVTVQTWGAGGAGAGASASALDGGGGGGGAFSSSIIQVTQGDIYDLSVGLGGLGTDFKGEKGGDSWFDSPFTVKAQGGTGGLRNGPVGEDGSGGQGGQAYAGYGQTKYAGGFGGTGGLWPGGGGGSSAGYTSNGNDGRGINNGWSTGNNDIVTPGGPAVDGGGAGGVGSSSNGGNPGTIGTCITDLAEEGESPGGGGGGGVDACDYPGQSGADGQVRLVWGPAIPIFMDFTVSPSATVCEGESVTLKGEAEFPVTYSWSTGDTSPPDVLTDSIVLNFPTAGTYSYTLTDVNGCAPDVVQEIVVNAPATVTVNNETICDGETATLTVTGSADSYDWETNETTVSIDVSPSITTSYSVTVATTNCPVVRTGTVTVTTNPTIPVTSVTTCAGTSATITASGGTGYEWTTSETAAAYTVANPTATATYTVTGTLNGCDGTGTGTITVNPLPTAGISGDATVCRNAAAPEVLFTGAAGTPPYTFTYTINTGGNLTVTTAGTDNTVTVAAPTDPSGTFNYDLVSVEDANGCTQAQAGQVVITVDPAPGATITGNTTVCVGTASDITFTGADGNPDYTFTYDDGTTAGQTISTAGGASVATLALTNTIPGTTVYTLTGVQDTPGSACGAASGTVTVVVDPLPTASIAGSVTICRNEPNPIVTLSGAGGTAPYTFTYSLDGGGNTTIISTGDDATISVSSANPATFTYDLVSVSDASVNNCSQTQAGQVVITIDPAPGATITGNTTVCVGTASDITFTGADGNPDYTFTYDDGTTAGQTISTVGGANSVILPLTNTVPGTTVYTLTGVEDTPASVCGAATGTIAVVVNPAPTATITGNTTVCQGAPSPEITFEGANGTGPYTFDYTENGNAGTITAAGTTTVLPVSTVTSMTFDHVLVGVTDANGCTQNQTGNTSILINPSGSAAISGTTTTCQNTTPEIVFTGSNGNVPYTFTYSLDGGAPTPITTTGTNSTVSIVASTAASGTITYSLLSVEDASNGGCGSVITPQASITVDSFPLATANGVETICENGSSTQLTGLERNGDILWTHDGNGSISNAGSRSPIYTSAAGDGGNSVTLTMTVSSTNTCVGAFDVATRTVIVNSLPTATIGVDVSVCAGDAAPPIIFTGSNGTAPYTFTYTEEGTGGSITTVGASNSVTLPVSTINPGAYTHILTGVTDGGVVACTNGQTGTATVTVHEVPLAEVSLSKSRVCKDGSAEAIFTALGSTITSPYAFTYNVNGGPDQTVVYTSTSGKVTREDVVTTAAIPLTYQMVSITDGNNCPVLPLNSVATITVTPLPEVTMTGGQILCADSLAQPIIFTGSNATAPYTFYFTRKEGNTDSLRVSRDGNDSTGSILTYEIDNSTPGQFTYVLDRVEDSESCSSSPILPPVDVIINGNPTAQFNVTPEQLTTLEPTTEIYNTTYGADPDRASWQWDFGDGNGSVEEFPESHSYADSGKYIITLIVSNDTCSSRAEQTVIVEAPLLIYIPTGFTPNGDGINDEFVSKGDGILSFEMKIYDRWGNMIFYTDDINKGWDGRANGGGDMAQVDAYVYVIDVIAEKQNKSYAYRGIVNIVR